MVASLAESVLTAKPRLVALGLAALVAASCEPDLPPGLGDRIPNSDFEVVEGTGSEWSIGAETALAEFRGKPTVIDFWASWCAACSMQHEYVTGLAERYGDRINVVGVLHDDSEERGRVWLLEHGAAYPTVREVHGTLAREFWVRGLPRFVLLDAEGRLAWDFLGAASGPNSMHHDSVAARIDAMLADGT